MGQAQVKLEVVIEHIDVVVIVVAVVVVVEVGEIN